MTFIFGVVVGLVAGIALAWIAAWALWPVYDARGEA